MLARRRRTMTLEEEVEMGSLGPSSPASPTSQTSSGGRKEEQSHERSTYRSRWDFVMNMVGAVVGVGNFWRFPFLVSRSGGAAFLVPYLLLLFAVGLPCAFVELATGQFSALPLQRLYRHMCPIFAGIGYSKILMSIIFCVYYNMIIAWSIFFVVVTLKSAAAGEPLPWASCDAAWTSPKCVDWEALSRCSLGNATSEPAIEDGWKNPAEEYMHRVVLRDWGWAEGPDLGPPSGNIVACLAVAWGLIFLCFWQSPRIASRLAYFTATLPFPLLLYLVLGALLEEGAVEGMRYFVLQPNWTALQETEVWADAASQVFFTLGIGTGIVTTLASYNPFRTNVLWEILGIVATDCLASFLSGFAVFGVLGSIAHRLCIPIEKINKAGITLVFEAYPYALSKLDMPYFWTVVFFLTLMMLGMDSQVAILEVQLTGLVDQWPGRFLRSGGAEEGGGEEEVRRRRRRARRALSVLELGLCGLYFLIGLMFTTPGGLFVFKLMDHCAAGFPIILTVLVEFIAVLLVYGPAIFAADVEEMMRARPEGRRRVAGDGDSASLWRGALRACRRALSSLRRRQRDFLWRHQAAFWRLVTLVSGSLLAGSFVVLVMRILKNNGAIEIVLSCVCALPIPLTALYRICSSFCRGDGWGVLIKPSEWYSKNKDDVKRKEKAPVAQAALPVGLSSDDEEDQGPDDTSPSSFFNGSGQVADAADASTCFN